MIRMRSKNLTLQQFHIQLDEAIDRLLRRSQFHQKQGLGYSDPVDERLPDYRTILPKDFRSLRMLCILVWWLPENWKYQVLLDLQDQSLSWLNKKQKLELLTYLSSKESTIDYLYFTERYSGNQIFGNLLGPEAEHLLRNLRISKKNPRKPKKLVYRRGYRDHGSRKPDDRWEERFDYSFTEYQLLKEKENLLTQTSLVRILRILKILESNEKSGK